VNGRANFGSVSDNAWIQHEPLNIAFVKGSDLLKFKVVKGSTKAGSSPEDSQPTQASLEAL
jgi:hypothetical protein